MSPRGGVGTIASLAGVLLAAACTVTTVFKPPDDGGADAPVACTRGVQEVQLPSMGPTCVGDLAANTFRYALCSCGDLDLGAGLSTNSYLPSWIRFGHGMSTWPRPEGDTSSIP